MLTLFIRAVVLYVFAVIAMRVMGKHQIGQLQPYELVVAIMIAELAAAPMGDLDTPLLYGLLPMAALIVCHAITAAVCMKSLRFRRLISGEPTVIIRDGVICEDQLRRMSMTLNDLMESLRTAGVADPAEVAEAVLETGGQVTVFPKAAYRALTPDDMGIRPAREGLPLPLVLDGRIQQHNLARSGHDAAWLQAQTQAMGFGAAGEVLFMCLNAQGELIAQGKGGGEMLSRQTKGGEHT